VVHTHTPPADLVAAPIAETEMVIDFSKVDAKPPPAPLRVPDFDLRPSALVGTPAAQHAAQGVDTLRPGASSAATPTAVASSPAGPSRSLDTQPGASVGLPTRAPPA
jgi:hypothetical protein